MEAPCSVALVALNITSLDCAGKKELILKSAFSEDFNFLFLRLLVVAGKASTVDGHGIGGCAMRLFAWVKPAFVRRGSPVDHTWVSSYDIRSASCQTILDVINAADSFWFCYGAFYKSATPSDPIVQDTNVLANPNCLVAPNNPRQHGTVHWYGIDGVCHQVANQVLYVSELRAGGRPSTVVHARGYGVSSAIFGTYGRRIDEWADVRRRCGVAPISVLQGKISASLFRQRIARVLSLSRSHPEVYEFENLRLDLLRGIDRIGFAPKEQDETAQDRVGRLNRRINRFLRLVANRLPRADHFRRIFRIEMGEEIQIVDAELFRFPDPASRPDRSERLGW